MGQNNNFSKDSAGNIVAEASELGIPAGEIPDSIELDGERFIKTEVEVKNGDVALIRYMTLRGRHLCVFND